MEDAEADGDGANRVGLWSRSRLSLLRRNMLVLEKIN